MTWLLDFAAANDLISLLVLALKGAAILLAATFACALLRDAPASLRHLCWTVAIAAVLMLPLFASVLPSFQLPVLPAWVSAGGGAVISVPPAPGPHAGVGIPALPPRAPFRHAPPVFTAPGSPPAHPWHTPLPQTEHAVVAPGEPANAAALGGAGSIFAPAGTEVPSGVTAGSATLAPAGAAAPSGVTAGSATLAPTGAAPVATAASFTSWPAILLFVWMAGALLVLLYLAAGTIGAWRLVTRSRQVTDPVWLDLLEEVSDRLAIGRPVQLLQSSRIGVPMVWGLQRPAVLLPEHADNWDEERRRCVLAHELAHVRRLDCLTQTMTGIACALHWFNPLVWQAAHSMQLEREKACDDYVLRAARTRASSYATHLIEIAREMPRTFAAPVGALAMARPSQLEGRVLSILDERAHRPVRRPSTAVTVAMALLFVLPLAALRPVPQKVEPAEMPPPGPQVVEVTRPAQHAASAASGVHLDAALASLPDDSLRSIEKEIAAAMEAARRELRNAEPEIRAAMEAANRELRNAEPEIRAAMETASRELQNAEPEIRAAMDAASRELRNAEPEIRAAMEAASRELRNAEPEIRAAVEMAHGLSGTIVRQVEEAISAGLDAAELKELSKLSAELAGALAHHAASPAGAGGFTDRIKRSFSVSPGGTLRVRTDQGHVEVRSGGSGSVNVEVERTARGRASEEDFEVAFNQNGSDLRIEGKRLRQMRGNNGLNVRFIVTVPQTYNVDVETSGGHVSVEDLNGRARLRTAGGHLELGQITGTIDAETSGGHITVRGSKGDVKVRTSGGNISLGRVGGIVDASTSGGHISIDEVNGQVQATTSGGSITARIPRQLDADSRLKTSGGSITVHLPSNVRVSLDAETSAGRVRSDLDVLTRGEIRKDRLRGTINGGGPTLTLDTAAGHIHIKEL